MDQAERHADRVKREEDILRRREGQRSDSEDSISWPEDGEDQVSQSDYVDSAPTDIEEAPAVFDDAVIQHPHHADDE